MSGFETNWRNRDGDLAPLCSLRTSQQTGHISWLLYQEVTPTIAAAAAATLAGGSSRCLMPWVVSHYCSASCVSCDGDVFVTHWIAPVQIIRQEHKVALEYLKSIYHDEDRPLIGNDGGDVAGFDAHIDVLFPLWVLPFVMGVPSEQLARHFPQCRGFFVKHMCW